MVLDSSQGNSIFQFSCCVTVGWGGRGGAGLQPGQLHLSVELFEKSSLVEKLENLPGESNKVRKKRRRV